MRRSSGLLLAIVLAAVALLAGVAGAPVAPVGAASVTQSNSCTWLTGEQVPMDVALSGSGTPANPPYLSSSTLSGVTVTAAMPWWAATEAYDEGLIGEGANSIPLAVRVTIGSTNAAPAGQDVVATATASFDFDPDLPFTAAGQAGQIIGVTDLAMPASTWTRTGQNAMEFREIAVTVRATLGSLGSTQVLKDCFPATWTTDDVPVATPVTPSPFAVVGSKLPDPTFSDVPYGHPFFLDVEWAAAEGVTGGYPDGTFRPTTTVSRQAFASFLYRAAGEPAFTAPAHASFPDVPTSHPFFEAIEWAKSERIIGGYADGTFRPTVGVSRQAAAQWLMLASGVSAAPPSQPPFPDVPLNHPFVAAIAWLDQQGIASGYADGSFRPGAIVSRQAAVAWLHRADAG
jgi:hypothetical protein